MKQTVQYALNMTSIRGSQISDRTSTLNRQFTLDRRRLGTDIWNTVCLKHRKTVIFSHLLLSCASVAASELTALICAWASTYTKKWGTMDEI